MKTYGFIFARGGSKGLPGKNIKPLCGKPLIAYAIEAGLGTGRLEKIVVSTDCPDIARVAREHGAEVPFMRPAELASDTAAEWLAWRHAISFMRERGEDFDTFISLPATSPLRTSDDVNKCLDLYAGGGADIVITCVKAHHYPPFNMIVMDGEQNASIAMPLNPPPVRRQDVPPFYDMTTVAYVSSPEFILNNYGLWSGRVKAAVIDRINAVDIDDGTDFEIAELFMRKRQESTGENA